MTDFVQTVAARAERVQRIISILRQATRTMVEPSVHTIVEQFGRDPFLVLVSCLLSLRARDTQSLPASLRLFERARTPQQILDLPDAEMQQLIHSVGFYKVKTVQIKHVCEELLTRFNGQVPHTREELLSIKGVGRKTANLVLSEGFEIPAICVDVHVHRISNRLGIVATKTPEQTETELSRIVPRDQWREINYLFVKWGQNICVPISPLCSQCAIASLCERIGVTTHR